jgi:hypothetical protein
MMLSVTGTITMVGYSCSMTSNAAQAASFLRHTAGVGGATCRDILA